jgi:tartrate-resistant acid phosphatase type 5
MFLSACSPIQTAPADTKTPAPFVATMALLKPGRTPAPPPAAASPSRAAAPTVESAEPAPDANSTTTPAGTPIRTATRIVPTSIPATATPQAPNGAEIPVPAAGQVSGGAVRIAVIGDYGLAGQAEADVARLVASWHPDLVITTGDNNYPRGSPDTIDRNVGQYYHEFIAPYSGKYGPGSKENRFFPSLGNHDWINPGARAYLDYFTLPGNERYYDLARGPVHLFALDSMPGEPDGIDASSRQAAWLRAGLANATEPWKLVYMHHPPYSSGPHGSTPAMRWPYGAWGATAVLSGHDHIYERIAPKGDSAIYFVNGLGGGNRYALRNPVQGSQVRYNDDFGAMLIEADNGKITFRFVTRAGLQIDEFTITR